jgi:hypothetical protein
MAPTNRRTAIVYAVHTVFRKKMLYSGTPTVKNVFLLDFRKRETDRKAAPIIGLKKLRYQGTHPIQFAD